MTGTYDYRLVALSVVLAMGASYAALDLAGRVTAARLWARVFWLVGGATAMGLGIWAMHYIGMLAFKMPMPVLYDFPTVGLSLLAAIGASAVALFVVSRQTMGRQREIIGSVVMGSGIAAMHYIGMAAMRVPARISYRLGVLVLSIVLAIVISLVALILTFRVRDEKRTSLRKIISALVMGSAIPLMHYTGMAAASFSASDHVPDLSHAVGISQLGIAAITVTSLLVLILAIVTAFLDRLLAAQKALLDVSRESESHFRTLAEAIPQIVLGLAPKILPTFRGALLLLNDSRTLLEVAGMWADCDLPAAGNFDANSCWALRRGQRHFVEVSDRTARCAHATTSKNSYLCIPIITQGGAVGVLHLQSMTSMAEPFESELLLINTFAEQVGLSISNLKLQEALRQQSTKDALTGLYNRRHLDESLEREIRRAARTEQPVAVVMFDLDHFKRFNDTFGHEAGDSVLRELGALLSRNARAEDIPCRFGGEEFLLILPGTHLEGAQSRSERLRSQARELTVLHQGKSVGMITISVGVAAFPIHGLSVKELIAAADTALYRAKKDGRDRVVLAQVAKDIGTGATAAGACGK
jgi:diguanylate cyclase (GGDEF)-like protein